MSDIQRLYRQTPAEPVGEQEDRDTIRCENAACGEVFVVEHVGDTTAWTCPRCQTHHQNLHLHFVLLGVATTILLTGSFALLVVFLLKTVPRVSPVPYVIWSAVQISLAAYMALAIFSDARAYGLMSLRILVPLVFVSIGGFVGYVGMRLWWPLVFIVSPPVLALWGYTGWVFWHAFHMADMHRPRESVVRPMYTLISITVHAIVLTVFTSLFIYEQKRTPGTSLIEFGKPGGYVPAVTQPRELEQPEEDVKLQEEEIKPELQEIETPETKQDIEYQTENELAFHKVDREEKPRVRPKHRTRNVTFQQRYDRQYALEQGGGSDRTEDAVLRALR
jgi:hypothetical protein